MAGHVCDGLGVHRFRKVQRIFEQGFHALGTAQKLRLGGLGWARSAEKVWAEGREIKGGGKGGGV